MSALPPNPTILPGAEPFDFPPDPAAPEGVAHAVLFLHGWTSTPRELRFVGKRVSLAGFHARGILLPGHGTDLEALEKTRFRDHLMAAEAAFDDLHSVHGRVSVAGLSFGGLLALYLATRRPVANILLYAPFLIPGGKTCGIPNRWVLRWMRPSNGRVPKSGAGPIFDPAALREHIAYGAMPLRGILENFRAARGLWPRVREIANPLLVFQSPRDPTSHIDGARKLLRKIASADKRMVVVEKSKHVITLDYDRERIEAETEAWLRARR